MRLRNVYYVASLTPQAMTNIGLLTVTNASFESPDVSGISYAPVGNGWNMSGTCAIADVASLSLPASAGTQAAYMPTPNRISQTVTCVAGANYSVAFQAAQIGAASASGSITTALDNPYLSYVSYGNAAWLPWVYDSTFGGTSARSGTILDGQNSQLQATVYGPTSIAFDYKVSSESNYDWIRFYIDDVQQFQFAGEVGWASGTYAIAAGAHRVRWGYSKDGSVARGQDAAFVDNVRLTPYAVTSPVLAVTADNGTVAEVNVTNSGSWVEYAAAFTPSYGSVLLGFNAYNTGNVPNACSLDNVRVTGPLVPVAPPTPPAGLPALSLPVQTGILMLIDTSVDGAAFTDTARTVAAAVGDTVKGVKDTGGSNNHWSQSDGALAPTLVQVGDIKALRFPTTGQSYMSFVSRIYTIRTAFWVIAEDPVYAAGAGDYNFMLGDTGAYNFHGGSGHLMWYSASLVNACRIDKVEQTVFSAIRPTTLKVVSATTSSDAAANEFSRDRSNAYGNRSWCGDVAFLLAYSTVLTPVQISQTEDAIKNHFFNTPIFPTVSVAPTTYFSATDQPMGRVDTLTATNGTTWAAVNGIGATRDATGLLFSGQHYGAPGGALALNTPYTLFFTIGFTAVSAGYMALLTQGTSYGYFFQGGNLVYYNSANIYLTPLVANTFYDLVMVVGATTPNQMDFYLNGVLQPLHNSIQNAPVNSFGGNASGENLTGYINDFALWTGTALTASDVALLHAYRVAKYPATF